VTLALLGTFRCKDRNALGADEAKEVPETIDHAEALDISVGGDERTRCLPTVGGDTEDVFW
jgi:hypothetical protein